MKDSGMVACSLHEIVEKATPLLKLGEKGASVKLQIEIPENLPEIRCNPDQIQQVLVNLLFNAADAIMRQGSILLSVSFSNPLYVTISIKDSGCGMSDEVLRQAFNPFFTTKPIGKGTGLGLYVCYNILENQNSKLIINSNPGKGTEVKFDLEVA
jgi:signal transduction histidine kinase